MWLGGIIMDLKKEFEEIDAFFNSISEEEFEEILIECGNERIKSTEEIFSCQGIAFYNYFKSNCSNNEFFSEYNEYNYGIGISEAA